MNIIKGSSKASQVKKVTENGQKILHYKMVAQVISAQAAEINTVTVADGKPPGDLR